MYAVIELQGHQWIVKKGDKIDVDNVNLPEGETLETDKILLAFDENEEKMKTKQKQKEYRCKNGLIKEEL